MVDYITVQWSSVLATRAEVWRVLDLSGMTKSVRESRNFTKAGFTFVDGNAVRTLKKQVKLGNPFTLELRFPNGVVKSQKIMLVPRALSTKPRQNTPRELNYRG